MKNSFRKTFHYYREHGLYRALFYNGDHIWLASFPRSGNTWMRHMLHDVFVKDLENNANHPILDIHHSVPDIHRNWDMFNLKNATTPFVKTHFAYQKAYQKVVYLIRDPVDVIYSLWKVLASQSARTSLTLDDVIDQQIHQGWIYGTWNEHILSYLNSGLDQDQLLILKYEQVVADPLLAIQTVFRFSGLEAHDNYLAETAMKHIDAFVSKRVPEDTGYEDKALALTSLQVGKGYRYMHANQIDRIRQSGLGTLAMELGYSIGED